MNDSFRWSNWKTVYSAVAVAHGEDNVSALTAIDLDGCDGCEVSLSVAYSNHSISAGARCHLLREVTRANGALASAATYEAEVDTPDYQDAPYAQNATRRRTFSVDPQAVGSFKPLLTYDGGEGSTATVTLRYRTCIRSKSPINRTE